MLQIFIGSGHPDVNVRNHRSSDAETKVPTENVAETKPVVHIPLSLLPEAKQWTVGRKYRVRLVLQQASLSETDASFEVIDAVSLEIRDKAAQFYASEGGSYKA